MVTAGQVHLAKVTEVAGGVNDVKGHVFLYPGEAPA